MALNLNKTGRKLGVTMLAPVSKGGQGSEITITRTTTGAYNPVTGESAIVTQQWLGSGCNTNYSNYYIANNNDIIVGDAKFLICPLLLDETSTPEIKIGDILTQGNQDWRVIQSLPHSLTDSMFYYEIQGRKQ